MHAPRLIFLRDGDIYLMRDDAPRRAKKERRDARRFAGAAFWRHTPPAAAVELPPAALMQPTARRQFFSAIAARHDSFGPGAARQPPPHAAIRHRLRAPRCRRILSPLSPRPLATPITGQMTLDATPRCTSAISDRDASGVEAVQALRASRRRYAVKRCHGKYFAARDIIFQEEMRPFRLFYLQRRRCQRHAIYRDISLSFSL